MPHTRRQESRNAGGRCRAAGRSRENVYLSWLAFSTWSNSLGWGEARLKSNMRRLNPTLHGKGKWGISEAIDDQHALVYTAHQLHSHRPLFSWYFEQTLGRHHHGLSHGVGLA